MPGVSLSEVETRLGKAVGDALSKKLMPLIMKNVEDVFKNEGGLEIKAKFLKAYDELMHLEESRYPPLIKGKDPSALQFFRAIFIEQLEKEIANIRVEGTDLIIGIGNKNSWGYGANQPLSGDPQGPDILSFYVEGITGTFGFITAKHYKLRRAIPSKGLGRFGLGFLISEADYQKERWEQVTKVKFSDIKHPISGLPPYRGFEKVAEAIDFNKYIGLAIERSLRSLSG